MKPFDIEAAKKGAPVCTRDGRPARIICWDAKGCSPIVALVDGGDVEFAYFFSLTGTLNMSYKSNLDLFMGTATKEGWINLYGDHWGNAMPGTSNVFPSEKAAKDKISKFNDRYLATVKIEWEE